MRKNSSRVGGFYHGERMDKGMEPGCGHDPAGEP